MAPAAVHIPTVRAALRKDFAVAAQNCWVKGGGAFTGELRCLPGGCLQINLRLCQLPCAKTLLSQLMFDVSMVNSSCLLGVAALLRHPMHPQNRAALPSPLLPMHRRCSTLASFCSLHLRRLQRGDAA